MYYKIEHKTKKNKLRRIQYEQIFNHFQRTANRFTSSVKRSWIYIISLNYISIDTDADTSYLKISNEWQKLIIEFWRNI